MASTPASSVQLPTETDLQSLSQDERLQQASQAFADASDVNSLVENLRSKAGALTNPKERNRLLSEAYEREIVAKGLTKKARILESGTFQGAAGGGGIGLASGMGLGTVVGTLVGTVVSVPTTLVGTLVGAGTGAIHAPWIKFRAPSKDGEGEGEEKVVQVPKEAMDSGAVLVDEKSGQVQVKDPGFLEKAAKKADEKPGEQKKAVGGEKKKPKKLEVRSTQQGSGEKPQSKPTTDAKAKKKPAKLEVRSKKAA